MVQGRTTCESMTRSWVPKAHWCMSEAKASPSDPIPSVAQIPQKVHTAYFTQDWTMKQMEEGHCLLGEELAPYTMRRMQTGRDGVMLWVIFFWETMGLGIHADVTLTRTTYLNMLQAKHTPPWQQYSLMVLDSFSKMMHAPCQTVKIVQQEFEEHDKHFKVLPRLPNSPVLNLIESMWNVLEKQVWTSQFIELLSICC